ncbi:MAG: hypothetical protein AB8H47_05510 [Bacteroidia bacterium]
MKKRKLRLPGSSLIEVLSGLSLISLVLGLGLMLFQRLNGPFAANELAKAQILCRNVLYQSPSLEEIEMGLVEREMMQYQLKREVNWYDQGQKICEIRVECRWKDHLLDRRVRLSRIIETP